MVQDVKPGGIFMINCQWSDEELAEHLNAEAKQYIAKEQYPALQQSMQLTKQLKLVWVREQIQFYSLHSLSLQT